MAFYTESALNTLPPFGVYKCPRCHFPENCLDKSMYQFNMPQFSPLPFPPGLTAPANWNPLDRKQKLIYNTFYSNNHYAFTYDQNSTINVYLYCPQCFFPYDILPKDYKTQMAMEMPIIHQLQKFNPEPLPRKCHSLSL